MGLKKEKEKEHREEKLVRERERERESKGNTVGTWELSIVISRLKW